MKYCIVFLFVISASMYSCSNKQVAQTTEAFPVTSPILVDTNTYVDYVADLCAVQYVDIRTKVTGYLEKVYVDEGAFVKEGQLLFSINDREYEEALSKTRALLKIARTEAKSAELEMASTKILVDKKIISNIEYEFAKNKFQAAKAKVDEALSQEAHAKQMLSYTAIRAPFSGTINRIPQKIGSLLEEGALLTNLSHNDEVYAYFDVSEKEYLDFMSKFTRKDKDEREVKLILANGQQHQDIGVIETMDGQIDDKTGNIAFRARFKNSSKLLKHGSSGKIRIEKDFKDAMVIPQKSTFEIQDRVFVFVIDESGVARMRQVEILARVPHLFMISNGIGIKDKIIYEGTQTASDGMKVVSKFVSMNDIIQELSTF
jgi:membrane fusion protein (multidrug efflux system)